MAGPAIPGTPTDRTGSTGLLRRALREIDRRWSGLRRDVLAMFDAIGTLQVNAAEPTIYTLTPQQMERLSADLQDTVRRWIADDRDPANQLWWSPYSADAAQMGAAQSVANLGALSEAYAAARTIEAVIYSEPFRNRVAMAQIRSMDHWTGTAATTRAELSRIIGRAVADGKNPKAVRAEIMARLEVGRSQAAAYAQTDITGTLREARWAESDHARDVLGVKTAMLWTSAFLATTRPSHAARSGHTYSTDEVRAFYGANGNRYNCFLPGARVSGRFVAGVKSNYKGPAVQLVTAGGRKLSVTANHPVMTSRGLVPAAEIHEGDQLVAYRPQIEDAARVGDLHDGNAYASIEQVFGALVLMGHLAPARVLREDFHGDAAFMNEQVQVVRSNRELVVALNAAAAQLLDEFGLEHADKPAPRLCLQRPLANADVSTARGSVRGGNKGASIVSRHLQCSNALGIASSPVSQAQSVHGFAQGFARDADAPADSEDGFAGQMRSVRLTGGGIGALSRPNVPAEAATVHGIHDSAITQPVAVSDLLHRFAELAAFDHVVRVEVSHYEGHVYDLQERSGLLIADGILTSNCHCGQTECLLDADGRPILTDRLKATMQSERDKWQEKNAALGPP